MCYISLNFLYSCSKEAQLYELSAKYIGRVGYYASLKNCLSGLAIVKDISVCSFLRDGELLHVMAAIMKYRDIDTLVRDVENGRNLRAELEDVASLLKNCNIKMKHIIQTKKFRGFGKYYYV